MPVGFFLDVPLGIVHGFCCFRRHGLDTFSGTMSLRNYETSLVFLTKQKVSLEFTDV
jgi:hypothetical protein